MNKESDNSVVPNKMTIEQLKLIAYKQRIGQITSNYEDEMADLRAGFTQHIEAMQETINSQQVQIEGLTLQLKSYRDKENNVPDEEVEK